jgi:hypothetical protein
MKELKDVSLVWERRCGRGNANQIYLARVEQNEAEALIHKSAPFVSPEDEAAGTRTAETALLGLPNPHLKICRNCIPII